MIKIIKWFMRTWLRSSSKYEQIKLRLQTEESRDHEPEDHATICAFCQELIKNNPCAKQTKGKGKRKAVAIGEMNSELRTAKKTFFNQRTQLMNFQEQVLQKYTMKEISSKRYIAEPGQIDILTQKHAAQKIQFSNKDYVLQQILAEFNLKTEAISRFVNHSQIMGLQDYKMCSNMNYDIFQEEMKAKIADKYEQAKERLRQLVANKLIQHQRLRKNKMVENDTQTGVFDFVERQKLQLKVKTLNTSVRQLKNEVECQNMLIESLRKLLQSKSIQFEEEFLNYRKKYILRGQALGSKQLLKSLKSFKDILEESMEKQNNLSIASIKMQESSSTLHRRKSKGSGIMKQKSRQPKKQQSIKFTLDNQCISEESIKIVTKNHIFECQNQNSVQILTNNVEIQTEPWRPQTTVSTLNSSGDKKFYLLKREPSPRSKSRDPKLKRHQKLNSSSCVNSPNIYKHIKSKVYDAVESHPACPPSVKPTIRPNESHLHSLVKKISSSYLSQVKASEGAGITCQNIQGDPVFFNLSGLMFKADDVFNLFLGSKNAQNYQCLLYRNNIFSNINPKRTVLFNKRFSASELDWNFKKEYQVSDSTQKKITSAIFHQIGCIKRRQKHSYEQIKLILRSPNQISHETEIINLESNRESQSKEIDFGQLKKMMNIILRFHAVCLGKDKEAICGHIIEFCHKLGISFN